MLVWVPDPVCQTSNGKCPSSLPSAISCADRGDRCGAPAVERSQITIDVGRGALDQAERTHDLDRHPLGADAKIMQRALGLRAPKAIGGNLQRPEGVAFLTGFAAISCAPSPWKSSNAAKTHWFSARLRRPTSEYKSARALREGDSYFLRKRSSRTTSPPPPPSSGFSGFSGFSRLAAGATGRTGARSLGDAGCGRRAGRQSLLPGRSALLVHSPAPDALLPSVTSSNCRPNCTDGSKNPLIAS